MSNIKTPHVDVTWSDDFNQWAITRYDATGTQTGETEFEKKRSDAVHWAKFHAKIHAQVMVYTKAHKLSYVIPKIGTDHFEESKLFEVNIDKGDVLEIVECSTGYVLTKINFAFGGISKKMIECPNGYKIILNDEVLYSYIDGQIHVQREAVQNNERFG